MKVPPAGFEALCDRIISGEASDFEVTRFREMLGQLPELMDAYIEQMRVHSRLVGLGFAESESRHAPFLSRCPQRGRSRIRRLAAAAAAAILLTGTAMWYAADLSDTCDRLGNKGAQHADVGVPPVRLVSQKGLRGLDLPETLPGTLRLESGEIVVRLQTGVELTLVGPACMAVESGIHVKLDKGGLLANVPHWATGFTVRTRELEIYDLGTVFGVQVKAGASDVFVFKGSVQVNEAGCREWGRETSGNGVGICEAGEGVKAVSGKSPSKIAADWPEAQTLFRTVQSGRAFQDPAKTMATAMRIADLWAERYMPGSNLVAQKMRIGNGIPFQKTAWVRPAVPQQEENDMNRASAAALTAAAVIMGAGTSEAFSESVLVQTSPCVNRHWSTVFTNEVPLKWDWPAAATRADLEINGMDGSFVTNFTRVTSNFMWRTFTGNVPEREDAYTLTLRFYKDSEVLVEAMTSHLAVVSGAFEKAVVDPGPAERNWAKVRDNAVIPYDATWTAATADAVNSRITIGKVGGMCQTNALADASGYFGWKLKNSDWGYGTFNLALTFPGAEGVWDATVFYVPGGTLFLMR